MPNLNKPLNPRHQSAKVCVLQAVGASEVSLMFHRNGYDTVLDPTSADILVWVGGEDVNPALYGEKPLTTTMWPNLKRDASELRAWRIAQASPKMMKVGICRGSQLLNVLNGGSLWQHVTNHGRPHPVLDLLTNRLRMVSSTHHQQFRPAADAVIVATAQLSMEKFADQVHWVKPKGERDKTKNATDFEVLWYPTTRTLCFQGHPEYAEPKDTEPYFFELMRRYY